MVPSIPSGSGAKPKREWRQSQIHANFLKYPPIAVLSLFNGLAALARGIRHSPISQKTHAAAVLSNQFFSSPVRLVARRASHGAPSFSDQLEHLGRLPISARGEAKKILPFPAADAPGLYDPFDKLGGPGRRRVARMLER
jgi:hypothetical protein